VINVIHGIHIQKSKPIYLTDAIKQKNEIRVIASERQINVSGNSNNNYI
jgi:hypothetical protein